MPHLITLTGPSQAGKSKAIELFLTHASTTFLPVVVPKFTTREPRPDDKSAEVQTVPSLPGNLDLVYEQYGSRYGVSSLTILEALRRGHSPILVLNDVRLITDVKNMFGSLARSVFLFRKAPLANEFLSDAAARGDSISDATAMRFKKAEAIFRIYIENIYLFDYVILNGDGLETLSVQIKGIVDTLAMKKAPLLP